MNNKPIQLAPPVVIPLKRRPYFQDYNNLQDLPIKCVYRESENSAPRVARFKDQSEASMWAIAFLRAYGGTGAKCEVYGAGDIKPDTVPLAFYTMSTIR